MSLYDIQDRVFVKNHVPEVGGTRCSIRPAGEGNYHPFKEGKVLRDIALTDDDIYCVVVSIPKKANRLPAQDEDFYKVGDHISVVSQSKAADLFGGFITNYQRFYGKAGTVVAVNPRLRHCIIECNGVKLLIHGDLLTKEV